MKKVFPETISYKIFETSSNFDVKWRTTGKNQSVFFGILLLVLTKVLFLQGYSALDDHFMKFTPFPNIS